MTKGRGRITYLAVVGDGGEREKRSRVCVLKMRRVERTKAPNDKKNVSELVISNRFSGSGWNGNAPQKVAKKNG